MTGDDTRQRLVEGTLTTIREVGFAGLSARAIASRAELNQALIFYHFGSMDALVAETCRRATAERVTMWSDDLDRVNDLDSLVDLARRLHARERKEGNVSILAQALAAASADDQLAVAVGEALRLWLDPIEATIRRIINGTALDGVFAPADLAYPIAASFVGVELFDGVVERRGADPFETLERLAALGGMVLDAGPIARAALRRRVRSRTGTGARQWP
jgi:AcrR family transcriptional regulator